MHISRLANLGLLAGATIAVLAAPAVAFADRPGTPNNEHAHQCNNRLTEKPQLCVEFDNTATEAVGFDIQFTVDGVEVDDHRPEAGDIDRTYAGKRRLCIGYTCPGGAGTFYAMHNSAAGYFQNGRGTPVEGKTGGKDQDDRWIPPMGFRVKDLDYGVAYCFRFKARRVSDDMVSENWSNWTCATTEASPPPKPSAPPNVVVTYSPGAKDWRVKPPKVVITWGKSENAASYSVGRQEPTSQQAYVGYVGGRGNIVRAAEGLEAVDTLTETDVGANEGNPSIIYGVCATNITGSACTTRSTFVAVGDALPRFPKSDASLPPPPSHDSNRHIPTDTPASSGDRVDRRGGGFGTEMSVPAGQVSGRSNACDSGYVWRVARGEDLVCVTPAARKRIARENADSHNHVDPAGAYGPNTCVGGYVWRDAFDGDAVCVTPEARALARQENAEAQAHRADAGEVFRAPH